MTETFGSVESTAKWYGEDWHNLGSHLPNNFAFVSDITSETKNASVYKDIVDSWMLHMPSHAMGQGSWFLGNHDHSRIASRFGNGRHESMAIISMMLPGVAMIYYVSDAFNNLCEEFFNYFLICACREMKLE